MPLNQRWKWGRLRKSDDLPLTLVDEIGLMNIHIIHFSFAFIYFVILPLNHIKTILYYLTFFFLLSNFDIIYPTRFASPPIAVFEFEFWEVYPYIFVPLWLRIWRVWSGSCVISRTMQWGGQEAMHPGRKF